MTISWNGDLEILAVLKKDNQIIDTTSLNINVQTKIILVDCAHGNIDFFLGKFSGMKMDLGKKLGFVLKSISKPFTPDTFKDAFGVIIPDPEKDFSSDELSALKSFVSKGGSMLLYCRSDYGNRSHPEILNTVLKAVKSGLRFNDDEIVDPTNNIGYPWGVLMHVFPSQITAGVKTLLIRSACSLLNEKMEGLTGSKNIQLLAIGDDDTTDIDKDELNDGWLYASHTPMLPIPLAACDDLGFGRVACIGEPLYDDRLYSNTSSLETPLFNRSIIVWLTSGREKTFYDLLSYASDLDEISDAELRAIRYESIKSSIEEIARSHFAEGNAKSILETFEGFHGPTIDSLKNGICDILRFESLHNDIQRP